MKISKKLVSFMLALAMVVTAMAVQTVPVQAKAKAIKITNIKGNKLTLYKGETFVLKTNYDVYSLIITSSNSKVVKVSSLNKLSYVKPGKATIKIKSRANSKVQKVLTVTTSNKCTGKYFDNGITEIVEAYSPKTKSSTYTVITKGKNLDGDKINVSFQFVSPARNMKGTGCAGEVHAYKKDGAKYITSIMAFDVTKDNNLKNIEKMTDSDWFEYWELSKSQIEKSKVEYSSNKKYYKVILKTPNDNDSSKSDYCCYIKNKATGKIYSFEYDNNFIKEYDTIKSIKLI